MSRFRSLWFHVDFVPRVICQFCLQIGPYLVPRTAIIRYSFVDHTYHAVAGYQCSYWLVHYMPREKHAKKFENLVPVESLRSFYDHRFEPESQKRCLFRDRFGSNNHVIITKIAWIIHLRTTTHYLGGKIMSKLWILVTLWAVVDAQQFQDYSGSKQFLTGTGSATASDTCTMLVPGIGSNHTRRYGTTRLIYVQK